MDRPALSALSWGTGGRHPRNRNAEGCRATGGSRRPTVTPSAPPHPTRPPRSIGQRGDGGIPRPIGGAAPGVGPRYLGVASAGSRRRRPRAGRRVWRAEWVKGGVSPRGRGASAAVGNARGTWPSSFRRPAEGAGTRAAAWGPLSPLVSPACPRGSSQKQPRAREVA